MNKKVILGIGIGIIFLSALFVVLKIVAFSDKESKELEITMKTNGGVPYKWEYTIQDESVVEYVESKNITPNKYKNLDGGPVYINYVFKGLKEGKTTITFRYISITDGKVDKEETVTVKVDGNKNISMVALP